MKAAAIAAALGGSKTGHKFLARCPAHDDCKPSLGPRPARRHFDGAIAFVESGLGLDDGEAIAASVIHKFALSLNEEGSINA
jgi:hypothetical protein